jgi:hypothetical protein
MWAEARRLVVVRPLHLVLVASVAVGGTLLLTAVAVVADAAPHRADLGRNDVLAQEAATDGREADIRRQPALIFLLEAHGLSTIKGLGFFSENTGLVSCTESMAKRIPVKNILRFATKTRHADKRTVDAAWLEQHINDLMCKSQVKPEDLN